MLWFSQRGRLIAPAFLALIGGLLLFAGATRPSIAAATARPNQPLSFCLLVSNYNGNSILAYDGTTGASLGPFVASPTGTLSTPAGMAYGPDGNLYVASAASNNIKRY